MVAMAALAELAELAEMAGMAEMTELAERDGLLEPRRRVYPRSRGDSVSDTTTRGIRIEVESEYEPDRSSPFENYFFFSYHVRISNLGDETSQLVSRVWIITDSDGEVQTVEGPGVVGETPVLAPGESFEYTSFCPLKTAVGAMQGHYEMRNPSTGETFLAEIAPFTLAVPGSVN
jgi:ApaG protein